MEVRSHTDKSGRTTRLGFGRIGHTSCFYNKHNAIYIFGGQQEREGNANMNLRDMQNDLYKFSLSSGTTSKVHVSNLIQQARRMFACSFSISQFFFSMGGISSSGDALGEILMIDLDRQFCR